MELDIIGTLMNKEKLKKFIRLLQRAHRFPTLPGFDMGLIVKEPKSRISSDKIFNEIKQIVAIKKIIYDKASFDEDIIENLIDNFQKRKWTFLEIKKDIKSPLLNQLKHLANHNFLQLLDYQGKDIFEMKMPENS